MPNTKQIYHHIIIYANTPDLLISKRARVVHITVLKLFMVLRRLVRLLFSNVQRSCAYTGAEFQAREL